MNVFFGYLGALVRLLGTTRRLARFGRDDSGATLVEFALGLPVFILTFAGIVHLGHLSAESVRVWANAHGQTFDKYNNQQTLQAGEILAQSGGRGSHPDNMLMPAPASYSSMRQLIEKPPPVKSAPMRAAISAADGMVFSAGPRGSLPVHGHFGEISARTHVIHPFKKLMPVDEAVNPNPGTFFGPAKGGSQVARSLLFDSPSLARFGGGSGCEGASSGLIDYTTSHLNNLLSGTGVRPTLAASMQYGTLTTNDDVNEVIQLGRTHVTLSAYFNVGMPPHTLDSAWIQPFITMFVSRLALEDCHLQPYNDLLGIEPGPGQLLPAQVNALALDQVPDAAETGLTFPLNYD